MFENIANLKTVREEDGRRTFAGRRAYEGVAG